MSDVTKSPTSTEFSVLVLISFHTKHRYSWISDAKLAIGWWRLSKIPVKYCSWSVLVFACHVTILSWTTTTPEFFLCCISNNKKTEWWFIDFICNIYLTKTFTWFYKTENIMKLLRNYSIETEEISWWWWNSMWSFCRLTESLWHCKSWNSSWKVKALWN